MLMAWCSTLGGAHSQLGETLTHHVSRGAFLSASSLSLSVFLPSLFLFPYHMYIPLSACPAGSAGWSAVTEAAGSGH